MSPSEVVQGFLVGLGAEPVEAAEPGISLRVSLEDVIRPALQRPPCGVAFSGGRDSSTILAIAVDLARREGLPAPVPLTRVFPGDAASEESEWQERVIRTLGLGEWNRVEIHDELDLVGPLAQRHLTEFGVVWPPPIAVYLPLLDVVRGGSLLDGEGGDEVLGHELHRIGPLAHILRHPRPFDRRIYKLALRELAPSRFRDSGFRAFRGRWSPTWLRPAGVDLLMEALIHEEATRRLSFSASVREIPAQRHHIHLANNLSRIAEPYDVVASSPLVAPGFVAALARDGGWLGPGSRTDVLRSLVPDLLPVEVVERTSKAHFTASYYNGYTRDFVEHWDGTGVDDELVDAEAMRAALKGDLPHLLLGSLLQQAWISTNTGSPYCPESEIR